MRSALLCLCALLLLSACGKKGNPMPPLVRVPAAPGDFAVTRIDDQVYVRLVAPSSNIDAVRPADVARIEIYAITLAEPPGFLADIDPEDLREASTLIATEQVRRPLPPPAADKEGAPSLQPSPAPGIDQGATVHVREAIAPELRTPATLPERLRRTPEAPQQVEPPRALVAAPADAGLQRYYFAAAVSQRGRYSPHTALVPAPLGTTSGPPSQPRIEVSENAMTLRWNPPADARGLALAADAGVLPSRPIVPGAPPTTYDVYEVPRNAAADAPIAAPTPLTPEPTAETQFTRGDITLGVERCFHVRAVDIMAGVHVRGPASPVVCASFADRFAPSAPSELVAVSVPGGINLIWEPSGSADVGGYIVLRGEAGGATLAPLMAAPVPTPSYRDETTKAGVRYVYAVVAVDKAGNRSAESNRVEETAQ